MLHSLYSYRLIQGATCTRMDWRRVGDTLCCHWLCLVDTHRPPVQSSGLPDKLCHCPARPAMVVDFPGLFLFRSCWPYWSPALFTLPSCTRWISRALISSFVNWRALPSVFVILWNEVKAFSLWLGNKWRLGRDSIIVLYNTRLCGFQVNVWMPNIKAPFFFCWCFPT